MRLLIFLLLLWLPAQSAAQELTVGTITRPPFSFDDDTGFAIDLWQALAVETGYSTQFRRYDQFSAMLRDVENGITDAAVANISITAGREAVMDFTQPIYASGLQIMIPNTGDTSIFRSLLRWDLALAIIAAFGLLFLSGMIMWAFERRRQEYFDKPMGQAMFPAFWWALNLVVNGGFEERQPRSPFGRVFAVILVISSLFIVSLFVAKITAVMTVEAIQSSVSSPADLQGRRVGVPEGSTAEQFARDNGLGPRSFATYRMMIAAFEAGQIDAVIFDAPILAHYTNYYAQGQARLIPRVFRPENYGIALPTGSPLREELDQALLKLRENGTYDALLRKWFGTQN